MAMVAFVGAAESASFSDWGSYQGIAIEVKLIGGQQYKGLYLDLSSVVPDETIADSVSCNFKASPVGSELFMINLDPTLKRISGIPQWLEYIPQFDNITASPLRIENGFGNPSDVPGLGIEWDPDAISSKPVYNHVGSDPR
jgi:hypothetical protein